MLQLERLNVIYQTLCNIWEEMHLGYVDEGEHEMLQKAVNCQVNMNRIVWALNKVAFGNRDDYRELEIPVWIPTSEKLPDDFIPVNVTYINRDPEPYYYCCKDQSYTATAIHYNGKWYWWSSVCEDYLKEYGSRYASDEIDEGIEITAWTPLPEPYRSEEETNEDS